nr:immunoglobulin light chain junction region [Macaca mulatta]
DYYCLIWYDNGWLF